MSGSDQFRNCFIIGDFSGRFVLLDPHIDALLRALVAIIGARPLPFLGNWDLVPTDELHGLADWGEASIPGFERELARGVSPACP